MLYDIIVLESSISFSMIWDYVTMTVTDVSVYNIILILILSLKNKK